MAENHPTVEPIAASKNPLVYFVEADGLNRVKIGYVSSEDILPQRLTAIQCGCPVPIKVVAVLEGGRDLEQKLHREFTRFRFQGEWFDMQGKLMMLIDAASSGGLRLTHDKENGWQWHVDESVPCTHKRPKFRGYVADYCRTRQGPVPYGRNDIGKRLPRNCTDFFLAEKATKWRRR